MDYEESLARRALRGDCGDRPGCARRKPGDTGRHCELIKIGGTYPLTGAASSYAPIPRGMQAYFSYVNATKVKGKRGVNGRQISSWSRTTRTTRQQTLQQTQKLVEQDQVSCCSAASAQSRSWRCAIT